MSLSSSIVDLKLSMLGFSPVDTVKVASGIVNELNKLPSLKYVNLVARDLDAYRQTEVNSEARKEAEATLAISLKLLADDAINNTVIASQVKSKVKTFETHNVKPVVVSTVVPPVKPTK